MTNEQKATLAFITTGGLRAWRKDKGISQGRFADAAEVSQAAVCAWERGDRTPSRRNLDRIERAYRALSA